MSDRLKHHLELKKAIISAKESRIVDLEAELKRKDDESAKLREFARTVIQQECWAYEPLDGMEIQDFAERLGLIAPHIATKADVDEEDDYEVGDKIYKFTQALTECKTCGGSGEVMIKDGRSGDELGNVPCPCTKEKK